MEGSPVVRSLIVKLASRCNLNCGYCYIYHGKDRSWRDMPFRMSNEDQDALVDTIEHLHRNQEKPPLVAFHGGEPLLIGVTRFLALVERIVDRVPGARLTVQSNGTIYNSQLEQGLKRFSRNLSYSLSLDGFREQNDRHRLDHRGRSRYARIEKTITSARSAGVLDSVLMVLDVRNTPEDTFSFMEWAGARSYNLILRDGDHDDLPAGKESRDSTEVGRWILEFSRFYLSRQRNYRIRFLDDIIRSLLVRRQSKGPGALLPRGIDLTIDTDGEIKLVDTLRVNAAGIDRAGGFRLSISGLEATLESPEVLNFLAQEELYAHECRSCAYLDICGGGYIQHRWGNGTYKNPSIYCADYKILFKSVERALA